MPQVANLPDLDRSIGVVAVQQNGVKTSRDGALEVLFQ